jgi:hypothetical protein
MKTEIVRWSLECMNFLNNSFAVLHTWLALMFSDCRLKSVITKLINRTSHVQNDAKTTNHELYKQVETDPKVDSLLAHNTLQCHDGVGSTLKFWPEEWLRRMGFVMVFLSPSKQYQESTVN